MNVKDGRWTMTGSVKIIIKPLHSLDTATTPTLDLDTSCAVVMIGVSSLMECAKKNTITHFTCSGFCCTHQIFISFFLLFRLLSNTIYLLLCIQPNLQFVVQLEKTKQLVRWHVAKVNVWACFSHGLCRSVSAIINRGFCINIFMDGTMHLVRVRNFGVVLLHSQSGPTPFHLLFLLLTDVCQSASLLTPMAVSPLGHTHTNWKKPPRRRKSHSNHRSVSSDRAEKHSLWLLREYHVISCPTPPIIGSSERWTAPWRRLAATSCKLWPPMMKRWILWCPPQLGGTPCYLAQPIQTSPFQWKILVRNGKTFSKVSMTTKITPVCDGQPSFRHFCHLSCVVLLWCERLS